jgi:hypothetical protein
VQQLPFGGNSVNCGDLISRHGYEKNICIGLIGCAEVKFWSFLVRGWLFQSTLEILNSDSALHILSHIPWNCSVMDVCL